MDKTARERIRELQGAGRALLTTNLRLVMDSATDLRCENLPTVDEVTAIVPTWKRGKTSSPG